MTADSRVPRRGGGSDIDVVTLGFTTSDGVDLVGDLATVDDARASAIICHPHPQYGGNRFNDVVDALFTALPAAGVTSLRFDFRPEFGAGVAERLDAAAALDEVRRHAPDLPSFAVGYSFGAMVVVGLDDARVDARVLVAPPLGVMDGSPERSTPTLVLTAAHDQFAPPDVARPIVDGWDDTTFDVLESVDHFLVGRTAHVADRAVDWLTAHLP